MIKQRSMKKIFTLLFIAILASVSGMAKEPFRVKLPPFRRYVKVADGVNLRQAPTTQSPRLVEQREECTHLNIYELVWKTGPLKRNEQPARATALPVWERSFMPALKEADGWLCGQYEGKLVYVKENFCKEVRRRSLPRTERLDFDDLVVIPTGKYKDYVFAVRRSFGLWSLEMGQYVDGMFVFNYSLPFQYSEGSAFEANGSLSFGKDLLLSADDESLDLRKLCANERYLDALMDGGTNINNYSPVTYYALDSLKGWQTISGIY